MLLRSATRRIALENPDRSCYIWTDFISQRKLSIKFMIDRLNTNSIDFIMRIILRSQYTACFERNVVNNRWVSGYELIRSELTGMWKFETMSQWENETFCEILAVTNLAFLYL